MASIRTASGRWVTCSCKDAQEYAAYLAKRYAGLPDKTRQEKINARIIMTKGIHDNETV